LPISEEQGPEMVCRRILNKAVSIACMSVAWVCGEAKESEERNLPKRDASDCAPSGIFRDPADRSLDPALAKLLDELETNGEPAKACELAEVWIAYCQGKAIVPRGVETEIQLGPWLGRTTRLADIQLNARSLVTGAEITGCFDDAGDALIRHGMYIGLLVVIA
jgi:hypothetical protein